MNLCIFNIMVRQVYIIAIVIIALISYASAGEQGNHLFILSGQSNMRNLDPNVSFTPTVEAEFGKNNVIVVKDAHGGNPIRCWYKKWKPAKGDGPKSTGDLYDHLMTKVNAAIKYKSITTVTFVWMQGESDAVLRYGDVYAASLRGLLDQLSEDLGRKDINFVVGRISDHHMHPRMRTRWFESLTIKWGYWMTVRKAQVEAAEAYPRGGWVDTDDLNGDTNELHYAEPEGYKILGKRFAEKAIELIKETANKPDSGNSQ